MSSCDNGEKGGAASVWKRDACSHAGSINVVMCGTMLPRLKNIETIVPININLLIN